MNHIKYSVLTPSEYSGSVHGDFGYEINGVKSKNSYVSRTGARDAMFRKIEKMLKEVEKRND